MYFKCSNVPFGAAAWQGQRWPLALLLSTAPGGNPVPQGCLLQQIQGIGDDLRVSTNAWSCALPCAPAQGGGPVLLRAADPGGCGHWQLLEGAKGRKSQLEFSHAPLQVWWLGSELFLPLVWPHQEGRMDLTAGGSFPVLSVFSFLSISRTATGPTLR